MQLRSNLKKQSILKQVNGMLVLQEDYIFNSPSAAATSIKGRPSNGWTSWKDKNGTTLDALKRK